MTEHMPGGRVSELLAEGWRKYPKSTLLSSPTQRGWSTIAAELRAHPAGTIVSHVQQNVEVVIAITGDDNGFVIRSSAGQRLEARPAPRTIWLAPIGVGGEECVVTAAIPQALHLYLPAALFEHLANQHFLAASQAHSIQYVGGFSDNLLCAIGQSLIAEMVSPSAAGRMLVECSALTPAARLACNYGGGTLVDPSADGAIRLDDKRLRRVLDCIQQHLEEEITVAGIADVAHLSPFRDRRAGPPSSLAPSRPSRTDACLDAMLLRAKRRIGPFRPSAGAPRARPPAIARQPWRCRITTWLRNARVLTEDRPENRGFFGEGVKVVVEVMVNPQRQINHFDDLGDDLRAAAEPCEKVANVAVVLFDRDGQVFAGEELVLRDEAVIALPIIGDERLAFDADFVEELLACGVITATKNPGDGSPSNRVIGPPNPQFLSLFFTKCHISSSVTTTTSALVDGSGSLRASSRTQFRTATSLTPRMRAMEQKLTLPMA